MMSTPYANTPEFYALLGRFYAAWSRVEIVLDCAIWKVLGTTPEQAHAVVAGMEFGRKAAVPAFSQPVQERRTAERHFDTHQQDVTAQRLLTFVPGHGQGLRYVHSSKLAGAIRGQGLHVHAQAIRNPRACLPSIEPGVRGGIRLLAQGSRKLRSGSDTPPTANEMTLILKHAASRPGGEWNDDDYDVLA